MRGSIPIPGRALLALGLCAAAPQTAAGFGHEWKFSEVYSNADGSIQFIEMFVDGSAENQLSLMYLYSGTGGFYDFPTDLIGSTANRHVLIATSGFAAQPGAVTPDYVIPDGFIGSAGDELSFWNEPISLPIPFNPYQQPQAWDHFAFGPGLPPLPTDGVNSLHRAFGSTTLVAASNSPTNFAGAVGSLVPEPGSALLLGAGCLGLTLYSRRRVSPPVD